VTDEMRLESVLTMGDGEAWRGPVPVPNAETAAYWEAARRHELQILRCDACGHWIHTPLAICPRCYSTSLTFTRVVGLGTVYTYSVVLREFSPGIDPPFVVALIELDEQPGLRILSNLVNLTIPEVAIGLRVSVLFHDISPEFSLPVFEPIRSDS
jgi:uncharacterized OB-fold protein